MYAYIKGKGRERKETTPSQSFTLNSQPFKLEIMSSSPQGCNKNEIQAQVSEEEKRKNAKKNKKTKKYQEDNMTETLKSSHSSWTSKS
jgi:hypothetical protein